MNDRDNQSKDTSNEAEESWLKRAAAAPPEPQRAAERLSPLPKTAPPSPSEMANAETPFLEEPSATASLQGVDVSAERYELGKEFARGGLGRILLAKDKRLSRMVAVKELLSDNQQVRERFLREVLLTAKLEHPGIVPIHDLGIRPNGELYYAMKLVDGRSLDKAIAEKKTLAERLALLPQVSDACKAIAYAHEKNVIHRDLKPHNIMVGAFGETLVIDWGLAKELHSTEPDLVEANPYRDSDEASLTKLGSILGTPAYMPLEQAQGEPVDKSADVYSLGAILYHVLSGAAPYQARRAKDILAAVLSAPPPELSKLAPQAPRELIAIVQKAMSRDAAHRYKDAAALADDLDKFQTGHLVEAHQYNSWQLFSRWVLSHRMAVAVSAVLLFAVVVNYIGITQEQRETQKALQQAELNAQEASATRDELREQLDSSILSNARAALERDPSEALAWLKKLPAQSPRWAAAQLIAADASQRGVADVFFEGDALKQLQASPDGRLLATVSAEGELSVWSLNTKKPTLLRTLRTGITRHLVFTFSPDSKHLAAREQNGNQDADIRVWEVSSWKETLLSGHKGLVTKMLFSPDGKYLAAGTMTTQSPEKNNKPLSVWRMSDNRRISLDKTKGIATMAFSLDSAHLWVGGGDIALNQPKAREPFLFDWDLTTDTAKALSGAGWASSDIGHHFGGSVFFLAALPSGEMLSASAALDAATTQHHSTLLRWSPEGAPTPWGASDNRPSCAYTVNELALSPSGKYLATICLGGYSVALSDALTGQWMGQSYLWEFPERQGISPLENLLFSSDEETLAVSSGALIYLLRPAPQSQEHKYGEGRRQTLRGHTDNIRSLSFAGEALFSKSEDGTVRRWGLSSLFGGMFLRHLKYGEASAAGQTARVTGLYASQDQKMVIAPDLLSGITSTWSTHDWTQTLTTQHISKPSTSAASPDGAYLALGRQDGAIELWDIRSQPTLLRVLTGHNKTVTALAFSPDSKTLVSGSDDQSIQIWELSLNKKRELAKLPAAVDLVQISGDGAQVIASCDRSILRWSLATGASLPKIAEQDHYEAITSPQGSWLAIALTDKVALFDLKTNQQRTLPFDIDLLAIDSYLVMPGETTKRAAQLARGIAFSPDGEWLAVSTSARAVRLIHLATDKEQLLSTDKRRVGGLVFSPDNKYLVGDGFLWELASGERRSLSSSQHTLFAKDGSWLVSTDIYDVNLFVALLPPAQAGMLSWLEQATNLQPVSAR